MRRKTKNPLVAAVKPIAVPLICRNMSDVRSNENEKHGISGIDIKLARLLTTHRMQ